MNTTRKIHVDPNHKYMQLHRFASFYQARILKIFNKFKLELKQQNFKINERKFIKEKIQN